MTYPIPVVQMMGNIVTAVQAAILTQLQGANSDIVAINYLFGHPLELIATLQEKQKSPTSKMNIYPLVMLFTDIPEHWGNPGGYYADVTLQMVIAYSSKPDLKAADRLTKNFLPILLPIYQELMKQIVASGYFVTQNQKGLKHIKLDRYYWGKTGLYGNTANQFNDFLDAIEIKDLQLKLTNQKPPFQK